MLYFCLVPTGREREREIERERERERVRVRFRFRQRLTAVQIVLRGRNTCVDLASGKLETER